MRVIIITYPTPEDLRDMITFKPDDYVIAVDQALDYIDTSKVKIDLVIGDFDSLKAQEKLKQFQVKKLSVEKDLTDTHDALLKAMDLNPKSIVMLGGMGGKRIEHFYAHLMLFDVYPRLEIKNEYTTIKRLDEGSYVIEDQGYISFFAFPKALLTLKGFKYDLNKYQLHTFDPLCISNERIDDYGSVKVLEGSVLMFITKKEAL